MMEIGSIIDILRTPAETAGLRPGDLLKVSVLEVFEHQRALVDLGRFRATAAITFPVAAGDELWVRVVETQSGLKLRLVPAPGGAAPPSGRTADPVQAVSAESFRQVLAALDRLAASTKQAPDGPHLPEEPGQILEALRIFLDPFELGAGPDRIARKLKEFCDESGLFLELRLAAALKRRGEGEGRAREESSPGLPGRILASDLKARLMLLRDFFASPAGRQLTAGSREAAGLAGATAEMLADIRAGQERMVHATPSSEPFAVVHFALPMPDGRRQVRLKIAYPRRRRGASPGGHRAAVLLELDRMGAVRADLTLLGRSLDISIFVCSPKLRDLASRHAGEVRQALSASFENVAVRVSVSARKVARFAAEDLHPLGETRVDVRV
jgi:hypothetical protein